MIQVAWQVTTLGCEVQGVGQAMGESSPSLKHLPNQSLGIRWGDESLPGETLVHLHLAIIPARTTRGFDLPS